MVNAQLALACLAAAATLVTGPDYAHAVPTTSIAAQRLATTDHALSRRRPGYHGLQGDELVAWANANREALRSKYASKLKSSTQKLQAQQEETRRRRDLAIGTEDNVRSPVERRDTAGSASLTNYQHDSTFFAPVAVGTPAQSVNLVLDTGSSDMWTVQGKENWNPASSSTFSNSSSAFRITYGSGNVAGTLATDTVTLAGHTSSKQTFAIATSVTQGLLGDAVEGIMGFGFKSLSTSKATPFWQASGASEFSFYLAADASTSAGGSDEVPGGTFTLGGRNSSFFQGDINWSDVIDESYWLITLGGITVNGQEINLDNTNKVAVDTGTTLIGAPDAVVKQIYSNVPGSNEMASGYFTFPCSTKGLNATLHFGDQEYELTTDNLIAGTVDSQGISCMGSFFSIGSDSADELQYILGDAFLKNVYSVFSTSNTNTAQVGFASLAAGLGTTTQSRTVSQVTAANGAMTSLPTTFALTCSVGLFSLVTALFLVA